MTGLRLAALLWAFNAGVLTSAGAYSAGKGEARDAVFFGAFAFAFGVLAAVSMPQERPR